MGYRLTSAFIVLAIIIPLIFAPFFLEHYYLSVLRTTFMWVALTISWYFFFSLTGYISLGSSIFFGAGLYFTALYLNFSVVEGRWPLLPFPVIVLVAGLLNFGFALVLGLITLRLRRIYFAIITFALGMACQGIFDCLAANVMNAYYARIPSFAPQMKYYSMLATVLVIFLMIFILRRSKLSTALKMIRRNEEAAVHLGLNAIRVKTLGFAISAACMSFVGSSYAMISPIADPKIAFYLKCSLLPPIMAIFGGIGTGYGPIIGAVLLSLVNEYVGATMAYYFLIIFGVVAIVIAKLAPGGIVGLIKKLIAKSSEGKRRGTQN